MNNFFSKNLRFLRKGRGMTQADLSETIDRKKSVISNYESGISEPSMETLILLADFFKVSLSDLIGVDQEEKLMSSNNTEQKHVDYQELSDKHHSQEQGMVEEFENAYLPNYLQNKSIEVGGIPRDQLEYLVGSYRKMIDHLLVENYKQKNELFRVVSQLNRRD